MLLNLIKTLKIFSINIVAAFVRVVATENIKDVAYPGVFLLNVLMSTMLIFVVSVRASRVIKLKISSKTKYIINGSQGIHTSRKMELKLFGKPIGKSLITRLIKNNYVRIA